MDIPRTFWHCVALVILDEVWTRACWHSNQELDRDCLDLFSFNSWGWSGGAMVLVKIPVPGRPSNLDCSRARAFCAGSRCIRGLFGHSFLSPMIFLLCLPLSGRWPDIY